MVLVPALLLALPLPPARGKFAIAKKDWLIGISAAIALASLLAWYVPNALFPRRKSALPLILFGTALLLQCIIAWNAIFRQYVSHHPELREVFRHAMRNLWAPIYGRYDNAIACYDPDHDRYSFRTLPFVCISALIAAVWYWWARRRVTGERKWNAAALGGSSCFRLPSRWRLRCASRGRRDSP